MRVKTLIFPTNDTLVPIVGVYHGRHPELQLAEGQDYLPDKYTVEVDDGEEGTTTEVRERDFSGITDATHNIDRSDPANPVPAAKRAMPGTIDKTAAVVGEDVTISGLPESEVWGVIRGGRRAERVPSFSGGALATSFDAPGTYTITLRHPSHPQQQYTVTVS